MQHHFLGPLGPQQQQRLRDYSMFYYQAKISVTTIHLSSSSERAAAYLDHLADFECIVDLAQTAVLARPKIMTSGRSNVADFGLHVGAIQPLYFTATNSPDHGIRRAAQQLLNGPYAQRQGWWAGSHAAEVVAVTVAAERV